MDSNGQQLSRQCRSRPRSQPAQAPSASCTPHTPIRFRPSPSGCARRLRLEGPSKAGEARSTATSTATATATAGPLASRSRAPRAGPSRRAPLCADRQKIEGLRQRHYTSRLRWHPARGAEFPLVKGQSTAAPAPQRSNGDRPTAIATGLRQPPIHLYQIGHPQKIGHRSNSGDSSLHVRVAPSRGTRCSGSGCPTR